VPDRLNLSRNSLEKSGMKCPACTADVADDSVFCPQCGARLKAAGSGSLAAEARMAGEAAAPVAGGAPPADRMKAAAATAVRRGSGDVAETELWTGGYSPKAMYGGWMAAGLATIAGIVAVTFWQNNGIGWSIFGAAALVIWGGLLLTLAYRRVSVKYRLTSQRLFYEEGILRRVTDRIELIDIDDVTLEQGLLERVFGVGTIHVSSSDRTKPDLPMPGIDDVKAVADVIDSARRAERQRRGLFIESV
jgi:membrane protein YdbS with pleckstrin-like domain